MATSLNSDTDRGNNLWQSNMAMNNFPWVIFPLGDWPALHLPFRPVATDNHTAICASTALRKQDGCGVGGFPHESATLDCMIWIVQCLDCKPCRNTIFPFDLHLYAFPPWTTYWYTHIVPIQSVYIYYNIHITGVTRNMDLGVAWDLKISVLELFWRHYIF